MTPSRFVTPVRLLIPWLLLVASAELYATPVSDSQRFAWSETSGWVNFKAGSEPLQVFPDHLEGFVWAENAGWIRLGTFSGGGNHHYVNTTSTDYGVNVDANGELSGYGWGENIGWVNFGPGPGQARIDPETGRFEGFVWSENLGWISLRNDAAGYGVSLDADVDTAAMTPVVPVLKSPGTVALTVVLVLLGGAAALRRYT